MLWIIDNLPVVGVGVLCSEFHSFTRVLGVSRKSAQRYGDSIFAWLVFSMSEFPVVLLEGTDDGKVPTVFRNKIFWIGFWSVPGVICWNIVGYFEITLPRITVFDAANTKAVDLGLFLLNYYLRIQPLLMGLAYLCPTDIQFSMWFYNIFKVGALNRTSFTIGLEG